MRGFLLLVTRVAKTLVLRLLRRHTSHNMGTVRRPTMVGVRLIGQNECTKTLRVMPRLHPHQLRQMRNHICLVYTQVAYSNSALTQLRGQHHCRPTFYLLTAWCRPLALALTMPDHHPQIRQVRHLCNLRSQLVAALQRVQPASLKDVVHTMHVDSQASTRLCRKADSQSMELLQ